MRILQPTGVIAGLRHFHVVLGMESVRSARSDTLNQRRSWPSRHKCYVSPKLWPPYGARRSSTRPPSQLSGNWLSASYVPTQNRSSGRMHLRRHATPVNPRDFFYMHLQADIGHERACDTVLNLYSVAA